MLTTMKVPFAPQFQDKWQSHDFLIMVEICLPETSVFPYGVNLLNKRDYINKCVSNKMKGHLFRYNLFLIFYCNKIDVMV